MHSEAVMHGLADRMVRILDTSEDGVSSDGRDELRCILDRIVESVPERTDPALELQVGRFVSVFREALEEGLSDYRLVQIAETFRNYLSSMADDYVSPDDDALYTFEYKMQNYAHYLFPDGSDDSIVSGLLKDREERLRTVSELMEEMGP